MRAPWQLTQKGTGVLGCQRNWYRQHRLPRWADSRVFSPKPGSMVGMRAAVFRGHSGMQVHPSFAPALLSALKKTGELTGKKPAPPSTALNSTLLAKPSQKRNTPLGTAPSLHSRRGLVLRNKLAVSVHIHCGWVPLTH